MIISLLTDYGYDDEFVGVCHAVIRSIRPGVPIVDVTHGIARHDVREGAIVLRNSLPYLPVGVHVAVVDPQVGTERRGVAIVLGGPFNSGILATGTRPADGSLPYFNYAPASPKIVERVAAIEHACTEFGVPLPAAALQFPAAHPAVATVIPGARSVAEFDANLRLAQVPIPREFWSALRERGLVDPCAPLPGIE